MQLRKKLSDNGWIVIDENHKIQIDYPTYEQQEELEELAFEPKGMYKYYKLLIKYCVKNWEGFDEKCELENGVLTKKLHSDLTYNINQTITLGKLISDEIEFLVEDKKK